MFYYSDMVRSLIVVLFRYGAFVKCCKFPREAISHERHIHPCLTTSTKETGIN